MSSKKRIIFHLDMDHFYTAVEERERPELKGKPVVVGADPKEGKGRGVVSTSNYEARKSGVRSGMPISRAWRLCPEAIYLPPNFPLYVKVSSEIMNLTRKYADKFEQWGIDEAFLDVSSKTNDYAEAEALARKIKQEISDKEQLTCSIGIGPNKLVAKIASDFQKPDGLTVVKEDEGDASIVLAALDELSEKVCKEAVSQNLFFKTATIKVRYENFETHTHGKTLPFMTNRPQDLKKTARELLQTYLRRDRKVRLIGVRVSTFVSGEKQKTLA